VDDHSKCVSFFWPVSYPRQNSVYLLGLVYYRKFSKNSNVLLAFNMSFPMLTAATPLTIVITKADIHNKLFDLLYLLS